MIVQKLLADVSTTIADSRAVARRNTTMLLQEVFQRISILREAKRRFADELAPDFRLFDYLRSDEVGLSRCLADLLDPTSCANHGKHGQGGLFLDTLISQLDSKVDTLNLKNWANSKWCQSVVLEAPTDAGRRIDILIRFNNGGLIGIENKPWAVDQKNQLADYAIYLKKESAKDNWLLIFLSNREPDISSIPERDRKAYEEDCKFLRFSYKETNHWLQSSVEKTRATKVRLFIEDLINFIRAEVSGEVEMSEEKEINQCILASSDNLEAAYLVVKSFEAAKRQLFTGLREQLVNIQKPYRLECGDGFLQGKGDDGKGSNELGIVFEDCQCPRKAQIVFGFYKSNYQGFYLAILNKNNNSLSTAEQVTVRNIMNPVFGPTIEYDNRYPWWIHGDSSCLFGEGFKDWQNNIAPWKAMQEKSFVKKLLEITDKVYEAFLQSDHVALICDATSVTK